MLDFETTEELHDSADVVGQSRALDAVRFGIDIKQPGFNLFVLGIRARPPCGGASSARGESGRRAGAERLVLRQQLCRSDKPRLLCVPQGRGG
ncbi:MAG: AAA family ATPase [Rhodocyclaceae bacterium]|nr:AAA family ATPase [Rhodocyclaceae bacterium]